MKPLIDRIPFARIITVLAISIGISLGLCGLRIVVANSADEHSLTGKLFSILSMIGLIVFLGSLLSLFLTCIAWVIVSIIDSFRR